MSSSIHYKHKVRSDVVIQRADAVIQFAEEPIGLDHLARLRETPRTVADEADISDRCIYIRLCEGWFCNVMICARDPDDCVVVLDVQYDGIDE